jgi:hypothetical protein
VDQSRHQTQVDIPRRSSRVSRVPDRFQASWK